MTETTLPFPFRFPEPGENTTHAGLCQECVNAPIVQTPCPHPASTAAIIPMVVPDEEGLGILKARPASQEPSDKDGCEVCGLWKVEHADAGHPFVHVGRGGRRPKFIAGAKR